MKTHKERVSTGIKSLDIAAQKGKLDKNWRYKLNPITLRISDVINNPLAQLFTTRSYGLYRTGTMGFTEEHGFLNYTDVTKYPNDATLLKEEWRRQLHTDKKWRAFGLYHIRMFRGTKYIIGPSIGTTYLICTFSQLYKFPANYSGIESAKRAVLKHHQKLTKKANIVSTYSAGVAASQALTSTTL